LGGAIARRIVDVEIQIIAKRKLRGRFGVGKRAKIRQNIKAITVNYPLFAIVVRDVAAAGLYDPAGVEKGVVTSRTDEGEFGIIDLGPTKS
jgi:hypothetical protein